jgi:hypothetical protein
MSSGIAAQLLPLAGRHAAVTEAGSLARDDVIAALDHAEIAEGPGGPAAMVPGQHHCLLSMYIAQARDERRQSPTQPPQLSPFGTRRCRTVVSLGGRR